MSRAEGAGAPAALEVGAELVAAMLEHARRELPLEACGLVGGRDARALLFLPAANRLASPTAYSIDPEELLWLFQRLEREGLELVGLFHSHPRGRAYPSATDLRLAYYPQAVYLIASLAGAGPELRGYRIAGGRVERVALVSPGTRRG